MGTDSMDEAAAKLDALQRRIGAWDVVESWSRVIESAFRQFSDYR